MSADTAAREITLRRIFDAPREELWRAWTEPERLVVVEGSEAGCPEAEQTVTVVTFTDLGEGRPRSCSARRFTRAARSSSR